MIRYRKSRAGVWYPEDRLRAALTGALVLLPLSTMLYGFTTAYVEGPIGVALDCICLFVNGIGVCLSRRKFSAIVALTNVLIDL